MPSHTVPSITHVNVGDPTDVALWALVMKTDAEKIIRAVGIVGPDAESVQQYLKSVEGMI